MGNKVAKGLQAMTVAAQTVSVSWRHLTVDYTC